MTAAVIIFAFIAAVSIGIASYYKAQRDYLVRKIEVRRQRLKRYMEDDIIDESVYRD